MNESMRNRLSAVSEYLPTRHVLIYKGKENCTVEEPGSHHLNRWWVKYQKTDMLWCDVLGRLQQHFCEVFIQTAWTQTSPRSRMFFNVQLSKCHEKNHEECDAVIEWRKLKRHHHQMQCGMSDWILTRKSTPIDTLVKSE